MDDEADLPRLREELYKLREMLARRQEAVAGLLANVIAVEARIEAVERARAPDHQRQPLRRHGAIRETVMRMLASSIGGLTSVAIGRGLQDRFGATFNQKTHLGTLTRLELEGLARRVGRTWFLTKDGSDLLLAKDRKPRTDC